MRVLVALCALAVTVGCGEKDEPGPESLGGQTTTIAEPAATPTTSTARDRRGSSKPPQGQPTAPAETPPGDPRLTKLERDAIRAVRHYVAALDARDGAAVCALLAPGALDGFELPEPRGDCAASIAASIGYRDPRGLPVWEGARVGDVRVAQLGGGGSRARVVATVATQFADRDEVSVEDDVVYLERAQGGWLIAKPSATLYRAVGISDIPLTALAPPGS